MVDIDWFKDVNDTYGHVAGDEVLKKIASSITKFINTNSFLCRWGGEEFAVVVNENLTADEIFDRAESIRKDIEKEIIYFEDCVIDVTVSIGVLKVENFNKQELHRITKRADECLYKAKNSGRNCCYLDLFEKPTEI